MVPCYLTQKDLMVFCIFQSEENGNLQSAAMKVLCIPKGKNWVTSGASLEKCNSAVQPLPGSPGPLKGGELHISSLSLLGG